MKLSNSIKYSLSWIFLAAFLLIKVSGLHSFAHENDGKEVNDCVWCHLSGTDNNTPLIATTASFELKEIHLEKELVVINNYEFLAADKKPVCLIFNKPPPFYTV